MNQERWYKQVISNECGLNQDFDGDDDDIINDSSNAGISP